MDPNINWVLGIWIVCLGGVECLSRNSIPIGGMFYEEDQAISFRKELEKRSSKNLKFEPLLFVPSSPDSFTTLNEVCANTKYGSWAALVDGSEGTGTCGALCQLLHKVQIPHLALSWRPPESSAESNSSYGLAYHPKPSTLSRAYATYIKIQKWTDIVLLYEDAGVNFGTHLSNKEFSSNVNLGSVIFGLIRLQQIMTSRPINDSPLIIRRLYPSGDNKGVFKELMRHDHFVVDCKPYNIVKYLGEIIMVDNHTDFHYYLFTSLDTHLVDVQAVTLFEGHITTMHMTDRESDFFSSAKTLQSALAVDAARHVSWTLEKMLSYNSNKNLAIIPAICQRTQAEPYEVWTNGSSLLDTMEKEGIAGLTGNVQFEFGYRTNFTLKISTAYKKGFVLEGHWYSSTDEIIRIDHTEHHEPLGLTNATKKIEVVSRIGKPYFGVNNETGQFEGFAVDLIDKIFKQINKNKKKNGVTYEYEFRRVESDSYPTMITDLQNRKADLAICDLTMTSDRQKQVDFSAPFMSLGITILGLKPTPDPPNMFSFLDPLALDLWLYLGTAYIFVSFVLLICARMSQEDWVNPHPCDRNPERLENIWDISNCYWLSMGTIMTQGCDILPRAPGSRWVTGMWWFFALIITASYTANMSTFLSESRRITYITSVRDLVAQNKIKYGTVQKQSTYKFFQNSNDSVYKKIFTVMESERPSVYAVDNNEGLERVLKGKEKYVFFMESTSAEYYLERNNCTLKMIGGRLDSKEYGIAMPRGSRLRPLIDGALLKLQEEGVIEELKKEWWEKRDQSQRCREKEDEEEKQTAGNGDSLQMEDTSGIFVVLLAGALIGLTFALCDFTMHAHKIAVTERVSWREALLSEWRSSLDPRVLSKPVAPPRSAAPSPEPTDSEPDRRRSTSRAVSVLRAAQSFINLDKVY